MKETIVTIFGLTGFCAFVALRFVIVVSYNRAAGAPRPGWDAILVFWTLMLTCVVCTATVVAAMLVLP